MKVYLQSFSSDAVGLPYSVCRFQPDGVGFKELDFFKPYTEGGSAIKGVSHIEFLDLYCSCLLRNYAKIYEWVKESVYFGDDYSLFCWCNKERQRKDALYCHTILIGYLLEYMASTYTLDIQVYYLDGREESVWSREEFYRALLKNTNKI